MDVGVRIHDMPSAMNDVEAVALLDEPVRRSLYEWVVRADRPVARDEAAAGVGASRSLAAFHLDRLVDAGLLDAEYRRRSGRTGPGAGRPAKHYRPGSREVAVSLPERRYELPARLFATTLVALGAGSVPESLCTAARAHGRAAGEAARRSAGRRPSRKRLRAALMAGLEDHGYRPRATTNGEIRLGNCPFHALVDDHRDLVCGMNLGIAEGLLDGLAMEGVRARLDPRPGSCCVAIEVDRAKPSTGSSGQSVRSATNR